MRRLPPKAGARHAHAARRRLPPLRFLSGHTSSRSPTSPPDDEDAHRRPACLEPMRRLPPRRLGTDVRRRIIGSPRRPTAVEALERPAAPPASRSTRRSCSCPASSTTATSVRRHARLVPTRVPSITRRLAVSAPWATPGTPRTLRPQLLGRRLPPARAVLRPRRALPASAPARSAGTAPAFTALGRVLPSTPSVRACWTIFLPRSTYDGDPRVRRRRRHRPVACLDESALVRSERAGESEACKRRAVPKRGGSRTRACTSSAARPPQDDNRTVFARLRARPKGAVSTQAHRGERLLRRRRGRDRASSCGCDLRGGG